MPLPDQWATPEDFATLFQYFWHRDFPMGVGTYGARRTGWNIHTGLVVRSVGDMMGLAVRFEWGGRKDALFRSRDGDEVAIEWEWMGVWHGANELDKLKRHKVYSPDKSKDSLRYAVLVTYTYTPNIEKVCNKVQGDWQGAGWPLLMILVDLEETKKFSSGRDFKHLNMFIFDHSGRTDLRKVPAYPWNVERTRWSYHEGSMPA